MEKCPKCKQNTLAYDRFNKRYVCVNSGCGHTEKADDMEYRRKHSIFQRPQPV